MFEPKINVKQKSDFAIISIALLSLIFSGFGSAPPAFAHGTIDQSHIIAGVGSALITGVGQGFTPTSDNIIGIDIPLADTCADTWIVSIHELDVTGPLIIPPFPHVVDPSSTLQHIEIPPTPLTPGSLYVIELSASDGCKWLLSATDTYPGGDAFIPFLIPFDFLFATYYDDGTVPVDSDGDGVPDSSDACPGTAPGITVDANGCPIVIPLTDLDNDGFDSIADDGTDCNDDDATIYPEAPEIAGDGIDQDCNGVDEPLPPTGDEKKSCETLDKASDNGKGKKKGLPRAQANNDCS